MQLRDHQQQALDALATADKGQVYCPTGGGKTPIMIFDSIRNFDNGAQTIVVVAPRILLANQLCAEFLEFHTDVAVMHVHSGETHHFSTTKSAIVGNWSRQAYGKQLIFTTYHSLPKVIDSGIDIDVVYFDEAHNAVGRHFFTSVAAASLHSKKAYFFTATPRTSRNPYSRGMNNQEIYGAVLCNVPAPHLINNGSIIPHQMQEFNLDAEYTKQNAHEINASAIVEIITNTDNNQKVLVAVPSSKVLANIIGHTDILTKLNDLGYDVLHITSKLGAYVNKTKVNREVFFDTLNAWGKDPEKKFVVLHHSILSEGINVSGLEAVLFMRNMDYIGISQSIGRVIRLGGAEKTFGLICVPVYDKVGINTARSVQAVVDTVFQQGEPAISVVRK